MGDGERGSRERVKYSKGGIEREGFRGEKRDGWRYRQRETDLEGGRKRRKGQGSDGAKDSDRDGVGLKEMEAEMKE